MNIIHSFQFNPDGLGTIEKDKWTNKDVWTVQFKNIGEVRYYEILDLIYDRKTNGVWQIVATSAGENSCKLERTEEALEIEADMRRGGFIYDR